ncbi:hypothetical protein [Orientia tsutsugamushi]|uniref:Integrase n=1 Tax=Orientia tsutsugamushi TaxID=784 RepID=A0A2U3RRZ0_ORITS|nr:hypothetical protein [Orientia tsutsugamushi]KJV74131.1 putative integrase [Orientia tsutsugamushi str. TA763]SPP24865.1 integrase [Orientia tsutsugamushi]SPR15957.1 integrase [Orientia tsutsugamushi]
MHEKYTEYSSIYHEKSWKKTYVMVKSYTAPFYHTKISEITVEDIQKLFDEKTAKKHCVTANDILMKLSSIIESQKRAERAGKIFTFISLLIAACKSNVSGMRCERDKI